MEKNLETRVLYDLTKDLEGKQHYMYCGSFFTTAAFVNALKDGNSCLRHREKGKCRNAKICCQCRMYEKREL